MFYIILHEKCIRQMLIVASGALTMDPAAQNFRPPDPGGCCICLEQSAGDSTFIAVIASFPQ